MASRVACHLLAGEYRVDVAATSTFEVGNNTFELVRPNVPADSPLRAWSAADSYAAAHLDEAGPTGDLIVVNDAWGALSVAAASGPHSSVTCWTDSVLSRSAISANLASAGLTGGVTMVSGDTTPEPPGTSGFSTAVIAVPKTLSLLEHQLATLSPLIAPGGLVVGCGMTRHIHSSTVSAFEQLIGATSTTRAVRKARLIVSAADGVQREVPPLGRFKTQHDTMVAEGPGLFSASRLDEGTALLIDVLSEHGEPEAGSRIVDLGCGNGVLGVTMARRWPDTVVELFDVSDLAVATARRTAKLNGLGDDVQVRVADGLELVGDGEADLVISNPPFHQDHAIDAHLTDRLLKDAARALGGRGDLVVVAQRHLNLHTRLKRWFGSVDAVSKHPSFVVLRASGTKK